ncbi:hypothetical protein T484DRAFT_1797855 [Baffinella frigidus]|nr:hypothetical protein T484DRAFT_1797855 [Cryptophyta sp. CCMP2293]
MDEMQMAGLGATLAVVLGGTLYFAFKGPSKGPIFLDKSRQEVPLIKKEQLSHDTFLFRFGLPSPNSVLGLPVGKHFKASGLE